LLQGLVALTTLVFKASWSAFCQLGVLTLQGFHQCFQQEGNWFSQAGKTF